MENRRGFLKMLGLGAGAGAFALALPQLTNGGDNPTIDRFMPGPELIDRNMLYEFQQLDNQIKTAHPREDYRPYLVDLYATDDCGLLMAMVGKCIELAMIEDTRGWTTQTWNERLRTVHERVAAEKFEQEYVRLQTDAIPKDALLDFHLDGPVTRTPLDVVSNVHLTAPVDVAVLKGITD